MILIASACLLLVILSKFYSNNKLVKDKGLQRINLPYNSINKNVENNKTR